MMLYKIDVNASREVFCQTIPDLFEVLLESRLSPEEAEGVFWQTCLVPDASLRWPRPSPGSSHNRVDVWRDDSAESRNLGWHSRDIKLSLRVYSTSPDRCAVVAKCDDPAMESIFEELVLMISQFWPETTGQLERQGFQFSAPSSGSEEPGEPSTKADSSQIPFVGFPETPKTVERWRKSYKVIEKTQTEYRRMYAALEQEEPAPNYDDLREALRREVPEWCRWDKAPQNDTIRKIIRAGEGGYL